jgi:hypothetical protein
MPELGDRELEVTLTDIGKRLSYPETNVWPAVRARIESRPATPWWSRFGVPRLALAPVAATLGVILAATVVLTPDLVARAAEALRLPGAQIFRVLETPSPKPTSGAVATFAGQRADSLADASRIAGFRVQWPGALGTPEEIYVETAPVRVTLVYRSRQGVPATALPGVSALVVEFPGRIDQSVLGKTAGPDTRVETVPVGGSFGYWLSGQPHQVFYFDASGNFREESLRLAGNTLLWEAGGVIYRLEADVSKEEAVRIASSFR